jgi:hypothetical protein
MCRVRRDSFNASQPGGGGAVWRQAVQWSNQIAEEMNPGK